METHEDDDELWDDLLDDLDPDVADDEPPLEQQVMEFVADDAPAAQGGAAVAFGAAGGHDAPAGELPATLSFEPDVDGYVPSDVADPAGFDYLGWEYGDASAERGADSPDASGLDA